MECQLFIFLSVWLMGSAAGSHCQASRGNVLLHITSQQGSELNSTACMSFLYNRKAGGGENPHKWTVSQGPLLVEISYIPQYLATRPGPRWWVRKTARHPVEGTGSSKAPVLQNRLLIASSWQWNCVLGTDKSLERNTSSELQWYQSPVDRV